MPSPACASSYQLVHHLTTAHDVIVDWAELRGGACDTILSSRICGEVQADHIGATLWSFFNVRSPLACHGIALRIYNEMGACASVDTTANVTSVASKSISMASPANVTSVASKAISMASPSAAKTEPPKKSAGKVKGKKVASQFPTTPTQSPTHSLRAPLDYPLAMLRRILP